MSAPIRLKRRIVHDLRRVASCALALLTFICVGVVAELRAQRQSDRQLDPASVVAGTQLFGESCSVCHGIDGRGSARGPDLTQGLIVNRGTDEEIAEAVRRGIPNSSMPPFDLSDAQIQQLVAFIRSLSTKAVQISVPGDQELGRQIFSGKGHCSNCHMIRGQGGLLGPDLSNIGADKSLTEIRRAILRPNLAEEPKYRAVTVVTLDGRRISGTLRNRDNFSLQMMDAAGRLHFFMSSELREVILEDKSPMPENYERLLIASELQDLLAFLSRQSVGE